MKVYTRPLGPVQANCYLIVEKQHALLIDPGDMYPNLKNILEENDSVLDAIVLTHAHFDHIAGVDKILSLYPVDLYLNPAEFDFLKNPELNSSASFLMDITCKATPLLLREGIQKIKSFEVEAMYCPGHSIGSTVLRIEDCLFTGDVLFQESIGRMDLATGSQTMMMSSLKKLANITTDYKVYPGHGPATTLFEEQKWNDSLVYAKKV